MIYSRWKGGRLCVIANEGIFFEGNCDFWDNASSGKRNPTDNKPGSAAKKDEDVVVRRVNSPHNLKP